MMKGLVKHNTNGGLEEGRGEVLVKVDHVSKKFCRHLRRSMAYGILELSKNMVGLKVESNSLRRAEFWALDDLNFELERGVTLGVLGMNGSGKTTLLRLLAGILPPDQGEIMVKGRISTLIAMGAGFHPHMTGRENIYVNGSILGMSRAELDACMDDIIDFAEIGEFLDAPVSTYSAGMRVRLGFSIATALKPDILLLDEVFAVGDIVYRQRCFERLQELSNDTVMLLTSHVTMIVENLCNRAMWLDKGRIMAYGDVEEVTAQYDKETSRQSAIFSMHTGSSRQGTGDVRFTEAVKVYGSESGANKIAIVGEDLFIEAPFVCSKPWSPVRFHIKLIDLRTGLPITQADCEVPEVTADGTLRYAFSELPLMARWYAVTLKIMHEDITLDHWRYAAKIVAFTKAPPSTKKDQTHPHEITVDMGEASYSFESSSAQEATTP